MKEAARDTNLSIQARGIAFWIFENPSEVINPDAIAQANNMSVGYVRKLLAELAEHGYLVAPQKYQGEKGRIAYTPYTLPPQALTTVTVEEPSRSENQNGQGTVTVETENGSEDAPVHVYAAGEEKLLSKSSLVLSSQTEQDLVAQQDQSAPADEFERDLQTRSPEQQAEFRALIAKAQPPTDEPEYTPPPDPAEPPAPDEFAAEAHWRGQLPKTVLSPGLTKRLRAMVKRYGLFAVKDAIDAAKLEGARVYAPMAWIDRRLEGQEGEGKLPGRETKPVPKINTHVARSHSQNALPPSNASPNPYDVFPWLNDKKIGAPA